jgi:predicted O-methyltransferase YrrM
VTKKEKDEQLAGRIPGVLHYHQTMLADSLRNKLLFAAIKQSVNAGTRFLDVGAGTGVWAILAAKLGAERSVAIEVEECLIPLIYKHAQENGVSDRIEIILGNSNDVRIRGKFDVIVSEFFGGDALGTETVRSFVDIRKRFLAPGGVLIPQKLAMMAAPASIEDSIHDVPAGLPLSTDFLRTIKLNYGRPVPISDRRKIKFLAEPETLVEIDFRTVEVGPVLDDLTVSWKVKDLRKANAIVTFNKSIFTDMVEMDAFESPSWGVAVNEFVPFDLDSGELHFRATVDPRKGNWTISVPGRPPQNYGPVFAFARIRMAQKSTPHRKFRGKKAEPGSTPGV